MPKEPKSSAAPGKGFTLRSLPEESTSTALPASQLNGPNGRSFEDLGDLPHGYGDDTIFLVAQEPHWLFTYWDIDIARHPGGVAHLRYFTPDGLEGEIEVPFETRNWYVPVQKAATNYFVEIGYYRGESWHLIARSITVTTPPEGMATSETFDYATVPFHLSFQRLLEHLESARRSGEDLVAAVSRLQQQGDFAAFGGAIFSELLTDDQRTLLQAMLGPALLGELSSGGYTAAEIEAKIRRYLEEQLSSGGTASEVLSSFLGGASLFSGGVLASGSSSEVGAINAESSLGVAALSSWAAQTISSWAQSGSWAGGASWMSVGAGAGLSSWTTTTSWAGAASWAGATSWAGAASGEFTANLQSWSAALGASWAQAVLASWSQAGVTSWTAAAASSWLTSGESSGAMASLSSWLQGVQSSWLQGLQSSWAQAALTSWGSAETTSWFNAAATTSWAGGSETLSSFGSPREFFMHVNAEVIFYGGTDPRATVTVDGQPIALSPDGTFRYHFVLPNADYEIPIVATSPDGVETRSATLRFSRETDKVGHVTDTAQPPLGEPMGRTAAR